MQIVFLHFTTAKEKWSEEAKVVYAEKLNHFCKFSVQDLKIKKASRDDKEYKLKSEEEELLRQIKSDDLLVLFDEKALEMTSVQFSEKLNQWQGTGKKRIVFVIGGAYGFSETVKKQAFARVSLSKMTMNHIVAKTVALEQIYRAFSILKNLPYHNE